MTASIVAAWVLTYALHSTLLLGAAWLGLQIARNTTHALRDRVWKIALFGGFATAMLQVGLGFEPLGGRVVLPTPFTLPLETPELKPVPVRPRPNSDSLPSETELPFPIHLVSTERGERVASATLRPSGEPGPWSRLDVGVTAGLSLELLVGLVGLSIAFARLRLGIRGRRPVRTGVAREMLDDLARRGGIRRHVRLSSSGSLAVPVTFGVLRPEICVPARAFRELGSEGLEAILAHELGHVARRDPFWRLAARAVSSLFFFQPLNRVASRELADSAEYLSDDWAVAQTGRELALASCLTEVATWITQGSGPRTALAPAMAEGRRRLGGRVQRLLDGRGTARDGNPRAVALLGAAILACVVGIAPGVAAKTAKVERAPDSLADSTLPEEIRPTPRGPLGTLDGQIAALEHEIVELRRAVLELPDPAPFLAGVKKIEQRLVHLGKRRAEIAGELPELAGRLADAPARLRADSLEVDESTRTRRTEP